MRKPLVALVLAAVACHASTNVPRSALISCEVEADCPGKGRTCIDGTCRLKTSACVEPVGDRFQLIADGVPCAVSHSADGVCSAGSCQESICGDGIVHAGVEECDTGDANTNPCDGFCTPDCTGFAPPYCGDGTVCADEECDNGPGNSDTPDACRTTCREPFCGDGITDSNEACDDGDTIDENGCSNACTLLPGWGCWNDREPRCNPVVFVDDDATSGGDGRSWATAYRDLESALAQPSSLEVWLAEGTYVPTTIVAPFPRPVGYVVLKDLRLYGGFTGNETLGNRRDWEQHRTVLSGDTNGDDPDDRTDNAYRVMELRGALSTIDTVVLDGVTISGGNADTSGFFTNGGGILVRGFPRFSVRNCEFENNSATGEGGALRQSAGELDLDHVVLRNNTANSGGAVQLGTVAANVRDCSFEENVATVVGSANAGGGAIATTGAKTLVERSTFRNNSANDSVGGALVSSLGSLRVKESRFESNAAAFGGAIHSFPLLAGNDDDLVVVDDSVFINNEAQWDGGAVKLRAGQARLSGCTFIGNVSVRPLGVGGGVFADDNVVSNSVFIGNQAATASAVYIRDGQLIGSTLQGNTTSPALYIDTGTAEGVPLVANNVIWDNPGGSVAFRDMPNPDNDAKPSGIHNCVQGGWMPPGVPAGVGNVDVDPQFDPTVDDNGIGLRLSASSPLIDAGSNTESARYATDAAGNPRFVDGDDDGTVTVDMGAFELP